MAAWHRAFSKAATQLSVSSLENLFAMKTQVIRVQSGSQKVSVANIVGSKDPGAYTLWLEGKFQIPSNDRGLADVWEARKERSLATNGKSEVEIAERMTQPRPILCR
jgi:hypothetical protein